jgi:AcrR family transcriptional regulator
MSETKDRILDAAERLIADQGYSATSLRHIIADAGVNLAAIHYHFGSKEELLDALILRRAGPVNAVRLEMLDRFEREAGASPVPVEQIIEAFLLPMAKIATEHPEFVKVMARMHSEGRMPSVIQKHFHLVFSRFMSAFKDALPWLDDGEVHLRVHFMMGAMAMVTIVMPNHSEAPFTSIEDSLRHLVTFLGAGFRAPAPALEEVETKQ